MPIDVALLGCAHPYVPEVLGVLATEPDLRLVAAWDADPSAIPGAIAGAAVSRADTALRKAHAAVIVAPTDQRPALCVQAARAGAPFLVAAPLARTAQEARAVAREVERSRTPAQGALHLRELPAHGQLRGVLRGRGLGRLAATTAALAHGDALEDSRPGPYDWMRDPERAGVGGFGDLAIPLLDALQALAPRDEPPHLAAVTLDRAQDARADIGGAALGHWLGAPLTLRTSWVTRPGGLELVVAGANGTATLTDGVIELARGGGSPERWVGAPPDPGEAVRAWAGRLRSRRFPKDGLAPLVRAQQIAEAAVRVA